MKSKPRLPFTITTTAGAAAALIAATSLAGCSQATPALSQCAIVTNGGFGSGNQDISQLARPGDRISIGNSDTAWYYPCDARNYVTAAVNGDRSIPTAVRTGPGTGGTPGMPVYVWTAVYWTPNQSTSAMKAFLPFCLKYGCASTSPQTDNSVDSLTHSSTPGWNSMLAENFGPALDRATQDVIGQFPATLWQDHSQWASLGNQIAANLDTELQKATGSAIPFFCGDASTETSCDQMQVVVNNVTPVDPAVLTEYNQQISAENALAANAARLKAAQVLYGADASYFLGLQDTVQSCPKCTFYIGAPPSATQPVTSG